jgi:RNA polymerase sigma factor (TIGR02999 family)
LAMNDVTRILAAIEQGDPKAAEGLLPLVYEELRRLAAQRLAQEKPGQTLQATALVHEAYLRLVGRDEARGWNGRGHFFAAAAQAMRRILVDNARRKRARKRGVGLERQPLDEVAAPQPDAELLALDEALQALAATDPVKARLVELRYFAGLTGEQAAEVLGISPATADRHWAFAKAWLRNEVRGG